MNADSFFAIGTSHLVCQDYARTGVCRSDDLFAVVSDGCSSSPDTDFGARFLTISLAGQKAATAAMDDIRSEISFENVLYRANVLLGLCFDDKRQERLDATLLTAAVNKNYVNVNIVGDGVVVAVRKSGRIDVYDIDYQGAPGYLSYLLDTQRLETYLLAGFGTRTVTVYSDRQEVDSFENSINDIETDSFVERLIFNHQSYELILVMTDGVHSFQKKMENGTFESISFLDIIDKIIDIKQYKGDFLVRRCRRFLGKYCVKNNIQHYDDFAVAGIYLGES